jgi:hypothetical protein
MKIFPYIYITWQIWKMFVPGDVQKFLLINNKYCLNQHSETHTLLVGVNKVQFVLSAFIVGLDEIWLYVM